MMLFESLIFNLLPAAVGIMVLDSAENSVE